METEVQLESDSELFDLLCEVLWHQTKSVLMAGLDTMISLIVWCSLYIYLHFQQPYIAFKIQFHFFYNQLWLSLGIEPMWLYSVSLYICCEGVSDALASKTDIFYATKSY